MDDQRYVVVELDFGGTAEAESFRRMLARFWHEGVDLQVVGTPRTTIPDQVDAGPSGA
ncbi:hypothetical protein [Streptomyces solincola]|uniref:hypothetical protein n=1 Tax=Streptomyces solincola TaxID=2100817 RepID=UPI0015E2A3AF|nr:hypothetical protein [Streptomyces solincola]